MRNKHFLDILKISKLNRNVYIIQLIKSKIEVKL